MPQSDTNKLKKCLGICNAFTKFNWLYEKSDTEVHTFHQPIETIHKNPCKKHQHGHRKCYWDCRDDSSPSYSRNEPHCTWQTPFQESSGPKSSGPSSRGNQTPTSHTSRKQPNLVNVMGPKRMNTSPNYWQQSFKAGLITETRYHNHCGCNGPTRISQQLLTIAVCTKVQAKRLL